MMRQARAGSPFAFTRWLRRRAAVRHDLAVSTQEFIARERASERVETCRRCGSPLADDQRYCLECGERRAPARSSLLAVPPGSSRPAAPPGWLAQPEGPSRGNPAAVLAGVGVLLLAMGVGVLIGRSGFSSSGSVPPAVVTVGAAPNAGSGNSSAGEFTDDWPSGKSGYTVLLQSLPQASTTPSAVAQAKSAAGARGAQSVGALKTGDFSSLTPGSYDIYSGEYATKAQAEKALAKLKGSFPGASVIKVSGGGAGSGGSGAGAGGGSGSPGGGAGGAAGGAGSGSTQQLQKLSKTKGKNYEQESKNLPNEVGT
jgi:hypothetical protein